MKKGENMMDTFSLIVGFITGLLFAGILIFLFPKEKTE
jgi:hypothetical protein